MAEVNHFYAENTTQVDITGTSSSPTTIVSISGSSLSALTKYLAIFKCVFGGTNAADPIQVAVSNPAGGVTWPTARIEPTYTTVGEGVSFFYPVSFTTLASPSDVKILGATFGGGANGWADQASILLIDLDDLGADNYVEASVADTDQGEISSTTWGTTDVSIIGSQQTASVEYLVLGHVRHQPGSTGVNYHVRLRGHNGTAQQQLTYHSAEGEDTGEYRVVGVMGRSVGSTLNAIAIQSYEDAANGNWHGFGAYLIAIDVSAFADFDYSFAATGTIVSNAITSLETTGDVTPTTAGNHLVLGRYNYTTGGNDSRIAAWLREDVSHTSDQSFSSPNTYESIYGGTSGGNEAVGQSIACGQTQTLYAIRAETVAVGGTPTDSLGCRIRTGSMTGTIVGTADNPATDGNQFTNGGYLFKFNGGVSVSSGTTYYVEWYRTGARDVTNHWNIRSNSGGGYSGGTNYVKSGDSWSSGTRDILFEFPSQNLGEWVGGDSRSYQTQKWDPTDGETAIAMWRSYRDSVAYNTELVGARHNSDSNATTEYEFLAVLNLNLAAAAAAPVFPRRKQTTVRM
jgi:hypothetical protein